MLLMLRITDRLQHIVEAGYAATVFWWPVSFACQPRGISASCFRYDAFLQHDLVLSGWRPKPPRAQSSISAGGQWRARRLVDVEAQFTAECGIDSRLVIESAADTDDAIEHQFRRGHVERRPARDVEKVLR